MNDIILSYHNSLIRKSDLELLKGPHWLNDILISFYFEYLENNICEPNKWKKQQQQHKSEQAVDIDDDLLLFVSPEVTQCIKIIENKNEINIFIEPLNAGRKKFIFFPINNNETMYAGGSHWNLLIFSRPDNTFFYYDSYGVCNLPQSELIVNRLKGPLNCENSQIKIVKNCLQQTNGYDCGLHVLCTAENIAKNICETNKFNENVNVGIADILHKRDEIYNIIVNQ